MLPPEPQSPEAPVLVRLVVPLKVPPLRTSVGVVAVKLPLNTDEGPICRAPAAVREMFWAVAPLCVNWRRSSVPAVNPVAPAVIVRPDASVVVAVPLPPENWTPVPFVEFTTILLLNTVPVVFQ